MNKISVHAVNLPHRIDRKIHIQEQFAEKKEFHLNIVPAIEHQCSAYSLWITLRQIVQLELLKGSEYFIFCEDDHTFTDDYSPELLYDCILQAQLYNADILSGGVSYFYNGVQVKSHLYWVDKFNGMQFTVIFHKFYKTLLDADFGQSPVIDINISNITENIFMVYPYISIQKEFGYSDVTYGNSKNGYVSSIFEASRLRFDTMTKVRLFYFGSLS